MLLVGKIAGKLGGQGVGYKYAVDREAMSVSVICFRGG